jgi:cytochrome c-type biogenesis protein CcsB
VSPADFASFSNNAIAFASVVYVLAFLSHVAEWAFGRSLPAADAVAVGEPVAVGAPAAAAPSYDGPAAADDVAVGRAADADEELASKAQRLEKFGRIGVALTVVAAALHLAGLVTRGLGADPARVPWGNMYEFAVAGAFGVSAIYLALLRKYSLRWLGIFVTGFEVVVLMLAVLLLYVPAGPLVPALQSYWLVIHVVAAVIATGAFTVGAMASALYLVKARAERRTDASSTGYVARLPKAAVLDRVAYRVHAFGFPVWTFAALVAGPIWAEYAWGRYWGWDPKEVWAFITWVVYAAYLHARATAGWRGKGAAVIALIGFATLMFNFVGINLFGSGLHSYSGLD